MWVKVKFPDDDGAVIEIAAPPVTKPSNYSLNTNGLVLLNIK